MWVGIVVFFVAGLIVAEVGRRGAAGTLPRNHIAGIRLPSTMRDDESWDRGHRAGGPAMFLTGVAGAVLAGVAAAVGLILGEDSAGSVLGGCRTVAARRSAVFGMAWCVGSPTRPGVTPARPAHRWPVT